MQRVITITSGKGGTGKTGISLNLALELGRMGYRVCLFDADLGLANLNILTGLTPQYTIESLIEKEKQLSDIIIKDYEGIDIIPGSTGVEKLADLSARQAKELIESFTGLSDYDYFLFDTSAGISEQVLSFCTSAREVIVVVTGEPTSLTDAYSLLKVLARKRHAWPVDIVVNNIKDYATARKAFEKLKTTADRFLPIKIRPLGAVLHDRCVETAVISQVPFTVLFPQCRAAEGVHSIATRMVSKPPEQTGPVIRKFWQYLIRSFSGKRMNGREVSVHKGAGRELEKRENPEYKDRVEEKIAGLKKEVAELKTRIEAMERHKSAKPPAERGVAPVEVILDFEKWAAEHKTRTAEH